MVWYGMVWYGMVWYGMAWYGMVWYGMAWHGMVRYGMDVHLRKPVRFFHERRGVALGFPEPPANSASLQNALPAATGEQHTQHQRQKKAREKVTAL